MGRWVHEKSDEKWLKGEHLQPEKWCHLLKKILCTFLSANRILRFCFLRGFDNYIEQQRKLSQGAICASEIAISADAKHCNSIILSTWFVKTCICGIKVWMIPNNHSGWYNVWTSGTTKFVARGTKKVQEESLRYERPFTCGFNI